MIVNGLNGRRMIMLLQYNYADDSIRSIDQCKERESDPSSAL
jgi:hypothetical protein